jgi:VacB/RNase II family 3'-5' exoribonuclease
VYDYYEKLIDYHDPVTDSANASREVLRRIARRVMLERGLQPDFGAAALEQLRSITGPSVEHGPAIQDLRQLLWASIDNDDSRDLDQLSVAEPLADGAVRIWVAIADVDVLVSRGCPIDHHARGNTTSVYTAGEIFPMLPERLSTDLTSLAEGQARLALVVDMTVDAAGTLTQSDIYRATVVNRAKLAYDSVAAWLEGRSAAPPQVTALPGLDRLLRVQDEVAQRLRQVRDRHGALTLSTLQTRAVFQGELLLDMQPERGNRAKELIEDFMIAANGVGARFLAQRGLPSLRRVLRAPERWDRIVSLAAGLGAALPAEPDAAALNEFLISRRHDDPARFADLSLTVVKLLGRGEYAMEMPGEASEGHFALAVQDYTHSTAPNRRFPDLITQRLIKAALENRSAPYPREELEQLASHCTQQEDNAAKVERQVQKSAAALLLASRIGERFDAIVTGASPKGTWARIETPCVEGKIVQGDRGLDVGDHVQVVLVHTDVERGFIDFKRVG